MRAFRRLAFFGTDWARGAIRDPPLTAAPHQVRITVPKVWISIASSYPQRVFSLSASPAALLNRRRGTVL